MEQMRKIEAGFGLTNVDRIVDPLPIDSYEAALGAAGLDGVPTLRPIFTVDNATKGHQIEGFRANVLTYPDGREAFAGIVGSRYAPFSDKEGLAPLRPAFDSGNIKAARALVLDSGARVLVQLKTRTANVVEGKGDSAVEGWISGSHSHDGSWGFSFGLSRVVAVCRNTAEMVRNAAMQARFKHTKSAKKKLLTLREAMQIEENDFAKAMETYKFLASRQVNPETVFSTLHPIKDDMSENGRTRAQNQQNLLMEILDSMPGHDVARGSAWHAYNAVTYRTDHGQDKSAVERAQYSLLGAGAAYRERAYQIVLQLANGETETVDAFQAFRAGVEASQIRGATGSDSPLLDEILGSDE